MESFPQLLTTVYKGGSKSMNATAQTMIKEFHKIIKAFPSTRKEGDLIFDITPKQYPLPKSYSEDKTKTKWEKFAEEKGIQKKKRSRMVYSEKFQKWMPRYGSRSEQNLILQGGVVEVDQSMSKMLNEKKKRIAKNKKNAENNRKRAKEVKTQETNKNKKN